MQKLNAAESIRGLASLVVVLSHLSLSFLPGLHRFDPPSTEIAWVNWIHHSPLGFLYSGTAAVYVFFVLSGYVLSYAIYKHQAQLNTQLKSMMIKRYPRLMIPVLSSCLITWLIVNSFQVDAQYTQAWLAEYLGQTVTLSQALYQGSIGAFLFAQSSVNWVLWTMQIEFFGSFLLFFLIYISQKSHALFFIASIVLPLMSYMVWGEGMLLGLSCFVIGLYIYRYAKLLSWPSAVLLMFIALYFAGVHQSSASYQWWVKLLGHRAYEYGNFFAGALLVYSVVMNVELSKYLDKKMLVLLGRWSFSIYLLHLPLLYLFGVPILNQLMFWQLNYSFAVAIALLLYMLLLIVSAAIFSRYIDQFAIKLAQKSIQLLHRQKIERLS